MPTRRDALRLLLAPAVALAGPVGCGAPGWSDLLVGTTLDADACARLASRFAAALNDPDRPPPRIGWVRVDPDGGAALERLVASGRPLDAIAGGDAPLFDRLARAGRLAPAPWRVLRAVRVGLAVRPDVLQDHALTLDAAAPAPALFAALSRPEMAGLVALDDPRRDPATLGLFAARLAAGPDFAAAYADLVRLAARCAPAGARPGAALARLARGELAAAPALAGTPPVVEFHGLATGPVEGVAALAAAPHPDLARRFVAAVAPEGPPPGGASVPGDLLATLLGAALVDAQPELVAAASALDALPDPARAAALEAFLVEAPPWPPASVQRLAARGRRDLVEALAAQVAPDLERRYWLLQDWEAAPPAARIDGDRLANLAGAVDGTLLAEPRLRAWLEAEWRTWTGQRGRRVARQARVEANAPPTPAPAPGGSPPA
jgi:hypothetical protein